VYVPNKGFVPINQVSARDKIAGLDIQYQVSLSMQAISSTLRHDDFYQSIYESLVAVHNSSQKHLMTSLQDTTVPLDHARILHGNVVESIAAETKLSFELHSFTGLYNTEEIASRLRVSEAVSELDEVLSLEIEAQERYASAMHSMSLLRSA